MAQHSPSLVSRLASPALPSAMVQAFCPNRGVSKACKSRPKQHASVSSRFRMHDGMSRKLNCLRCCIRVACFRRQWVPRGRLSALWAYYNKAKSPGNSHDRAPELSRAPKPSSANMLVQYQLKVDKKALRLSPTMAPQWRETSRRWSLFRTPRHLSKGRKGTMPDNLLHGNPGLVSKIQLRDQKQRDVKLPFLN